jgi:chromosome segregation ATPase
MDKVGTDEAVQSLHQEVEIKEQQMKVKDDEIEELIQEKSTIENEKNQLKKEMEQMKIKNLLQKNITTNMKGKGSDMNQTDKSIDSRRAEVEKEVTDLQEQNQKLKSQVLALQQLQRKTVYGASFVESKQEMKDLSKEALSQSKISNAEVQPE